MTSVTTAAMIDPAQATTVGATLETPTTRAVVLDPALLAANESAILERIAIATTGLFALSETATTIETATLVDATTVVSATDAHPLMPVLSGTIRIYILRKLHVGSLGHGCSGEAARTVIGTAQCACVFFQQYLLFVRDFTSTSAFQTPKLPFPTLTKLRRHANFSGKVTIQASI
ncbi:hypothetical protein EJ04DRAFT_568495 [Polyplosphaeria fusca]|uniref:Uncharacterized protein n=1 Tax=Polyplosphaeria fusca TaxID=682080 RepID=A0A9P4UV55_9PLEO|nr:hypothetical protein EJ04DRAFT_568495 [Polyplosphaeria fusca]